MDSNYIFHHKKFNKIKKMAKNKNTPKEILDKLSSSNDLMIRAFVAMNESTHIKTLAKLANDRSDAVKNAVSKNKNRPCFLRIILTYIFVRIKYDTI